MVCTACHTSVHGTGLDLATNLDTAYSLLVDVASVQNMAVDRVTANEPGADVSYLIAKLQAANTYRGMTGRMPADGDFLNAAELKVFTDWIANGAPKE